MENATPANVTQVASGGTDAANQTDPRAKNDSNGPHVDQLDEAALSRVAAARAADRRTAAAQIGLNTVEAVRVIDLLASKDEKESSQDKGQGTSSAKGKNASPEAEADPKDGSASKRERPAFLDKMYIEADNKFYFRGRENELAFEDKGKALSTPHNNADVSRSMIELAHSKGWTSINLSGHEDFKRGAWLQASLKGMEVTGYKPKAVDIARLEELQASQKTENRVSEGKGQSKQPEAASTGVGVKPATDKARGLSNAEQIAEVARRAAEEKGFSPTAQNVVAKVARERVESFERDGSKATMVKFDQNAERTRTRVASVPTKEFERGNRER